ncbi:MAG: CHAT domain-containing protein, partial [Gemmatimonadales bacterium]
RVAAAEALAIYERTGPAADALQVRRLLADVLAAAGDIQGALDELQQAQTLATTAEAGPRVGAALALSRADLAVRLNALGDAEQRYRLAERLYRSAGDREGEAEAQHGRGLLALARDDTPRAEALLTAALRGQTAVRSRRAAALTRLSLGRVFWQRGDTTRARRQLSQAVQELEQLGDVVALAEALGERGALEGEAGAPAAAESFYRAALRRLEGRPVPETAWRLRSGLGMALKARGAHDAAARELRAAVEALDRPSRSLVLPERRSAFLADKWETYAQLALVERARGLPALAFETSERLRAREMLELLDRGRVAAAPDAAPDLVGREQDLRRRITELTREVDRLVPGREAVRGPDLTRVPSATRQSLLQAQEEYGDLLLRMRERAPRHAEFVSPRPASWREIARRLEPDQALVSYLLSDSGSVAFVVTPDTMVAVDLEVRRHELARLVEFARGTLERPLSDSLWQGPFRRLHAYLVAPVEETRLLARTSRLVLAPHGELHYLPFSALLPERGGRLFGERYQLSVTPSASAWLTLGDRPAAGNPSGVLAVAPRADALPASRQEVAAIGRLVAGDVQVRVGRSASEELFRREARGRRIVHLATYGVLNKQNPLFSFIELAGGDGHDGRLEVHEVFGLELTADLVVLSACQTGLGSGALADVPAGDDWVGLTRAFLHAGARQVIATLWAVDDWATAALMERFYRSLAGGNDPARALAEAQRALRGETATAHPRYWAGFVLVGGRDSHRLSGAQP